MMKQEYFIVKWWPKRIDFVFYAGDRVSFGFVLCLVCVLWRVFSFFFLYFHVNIDRHLERFSSETLLEPLRNLRNSLEIGERISF